MAQFVDVPASQLEPDTLNALLEEFASRDGTDYGLRELPLEDKVARLQRALVVEDKAERALRFHRNTVKGLAGMTAACGLDHPNEFVVAFSHPDEIVIRRSSLKSLRRNKLFKLGNSLVGIFRTNELRKGA